MKIGQRSMFRRERQSPLVRMLGSDEAELLLYGEIGGWWGVPADEFRRQLDAIAAGTIHLHINSPGGSVFDGLAIYNSLREHDARVVTHVDGIAASMASFVALAGDEVHVSENSWVMIHEPWTITIGNAEQLRKDASLLDKIGGQAAERYRKKTKATADQVHEWMAAETWWTGVEALEVGFADEMDNVVPEEEDEGAQLAALFDLSVFANVPDALVARGSGARREPTTRELERALRDAGLSRSEAARLVAVREGPRDATTVPKASDLSADPLYREVLAQLRTYRKDMQNG